MAYFNYFIKCVIRRFVYFICKPKVAFTILLSTAIFFAMRYYGYCSWTDGEIEACLDGLSTITNNQGVVISQLASMGVNVTNIKNDLDSINSKLSDIKSSTSDIGSKLSTVITDIENLNVLLTQLAQQQNIYYENVQTQLNDLKNLLIGGETETSDVTLKSFSFGNLSPDMGGNGTYTISSDSVDVGFTAFNYTFEKGYTYEISRSSGGSSYSRILGTMDDVIVNGNSFYLNFLFDGAVTNASFSFTPKKTGDLTIVVNNPSGVDGTVWTITKKASGSLSNINDTISQGNQFQQEQNQLQQEQNDFLKNDNVSVDSSSLPSDTSQDITEDGFNSIFQQIYNTFTSGASQDVVITIPFTDKSFTINANTVYGNVNLGFIKTLIEAFWYFVISYFIVQDIAKKINKIKSGDIEHVQEDNIKEDLL